MPIKFGSDGFRGVIGEDFTYENVARIASAVATWWLDDCRLDKKQVAIGYDCRFLSLPMAKLAAATLRRCGPFEPLIADSPCPSPYLAFCTSLIGPLGIQVTASHNPYYYNGIKLKAGYGGSQQDCVVRIIEQLANSKTIGDHSWTEANQPLDRRAEYFAAIDDAVGNLSVQSTIVDYMHGAAQDIYSTHLDKRSLVQAELHKSIDPRFGGSKPEPMEHLLPELIQRVRDANGGTVGIAFDGDGDRLAVIDETGTYLQSHEIFALLLDFLARSGYPGKKVVTTVSFSSLLGRIAESYGLETLEVPVGFKHVSEAMLAGGVLIGGEESGGAAFGHYLPERDALLMALTLLRAKGEAGVTLHEMLRDIYARFGRTEFVHLDVQLDPASAQEFRARIPSLLEVGSVAGETVTSRSDKDGVKLRTAEGWVLVRASGTEPLARFYAEAGSKATAQRMVDDVRARILNRRV